MKRVGPVNEYPSRVCVEEVDPAMIGRRGPAREDSNAQVRENPKDGEREKSEYILQVRSAYLDL